MLVAPASPAAATYTGCEHARTHEAHQRVPKRNQGTERAHHSIPYCPPEDAPQRHQP